MSSPSHLTGLRVLLTRPVGHVDVWRESLEGAGASVIHYPTIEVGPPPSWRPLDDAFSRLGTYEWLIFASASVARLACARLPNAFGTSSTIWPRVAAVGAETARALVALGVPVDLVPAQQDQDGLAAALTGLPEGTRILFPQAVGGREELPKTLAARGCVVDVVPASATRPVHLALPPPEFDVATFASPSALRAFLGGPGPGLLSGKPVVVVGPTTAREARAHGLSPVVADAPNVQAVIRAIAAAVMRPQGGP